MRPVSPADTAAAEDQAWRGFMDRLAALLAQHWPAMPERLAERYPAFVALAVQQAQGHGLQRAASVARLVNLWFVWGPAFHERPGFEWAPPLLAGAAGQEWLAVHQLVQRSLAELQRLAGARITPQALAVADAALIDAFAALGRQGRLHPAEPADAPRQACDLDAADIRLLDANWHQQYQLADAPDSTLAADWTRVASAWPAPLRLDAGHPLPLLLAALSHPLGQGPQAELQVKLRPLVLCDGDTHPLLGFAGPHGRWVWAGHAGKSASWPLATREQAAPRAGPGCIVAELTSPELHRLDLQTCGLRDSGPAIGPLRTTVAVWPATQWWTELQRAMPAAQPLLPGARTWQRGSTVCRVERDGQPQDSSALRQQFEAGLDSAVAHGLQTLAASWQAASGVGAPTCEATLGMLTGQASLSWGWAFGPGGLAGPALMRLLGLIALDACRADLSLVGEWSSDSAAGGVFAGTRTRLTLRLGGQARLQQRLQHESAEPPHADLLGALVVRWRWPADLLVEPLAVASGRLVQALGPASGALVGEAGLRPCSSGSSGWEWFAGLRIEPAAVTLGAADPLLGWQQQTLCLLPALALVDWRLG